MDDLEKEFLGKLTELSQKYQIGIAGSPVLYLMEPDDSERRYSTDKDNLVFK